VRVAFIGGTGPAGIGIGARLARAGHEVFIGSRSKERADEAVAKIVELAGGGSVRGGTNEEVIAQAEVVFLAMRDDAQRETVRTIADLLAGRVIVSMANPLRVGNGMATFVNPPEGSLAEEAQRDAPDAHVVSAFHEIRVSKFSKLDKDINSDTIVCGDDDGAKKKVIALARDVGVRPVDGGPLSNSRYVEAFVALLITINFKYKASAGVRITGLPD
jgi:NADPH-dependent F420 reductase